MIGIIIIAAVAIGDAVMNLTKDSAANVGGGIESIAAIVSTAISEAESLAAGSRPLAAAGHS